MTAIAIRWPGTLRDVGSRTLEHRFVEHFAAIVREIVDRDFRDRPEDATGNQRRAAKHLGISQAQISDFYNLRPGKGVGVSTLLALRRYTSRTLDDLLGLDPLPSEQLVAQIRASIEAYASGQPMPAKGQPAPAKPPRGLPGGVASVVEHVPGSSKKASQEAHQRKMSARKQNRERAALEATGKAPTVHRRKRGEAR